MPKKKLGFDLIVLGDPTAGKDTQATILMQKYAFQPVESGKFSRALAKKNTPDGRWLRRTMSLGHPTPVVIMKRFIKSQILKVSKNRNLIFIGNPRLKPEAQMVKKLLEEKNRDFFAIYLKIPEAEIYKRTKSRLRQLPESSKQGIVNRINYHKYQTSKVVKYFRSMHKLKFIDSAKPISMVSKNIQKTLDDYTRSKRN